MEIGEIWARVQNVSRHTQNNRNRRFNYFENFDLCAFYAFCTIQCTLTDIYYPFLEDSKKTSVIRYSLLWSPECFIKFSINSYIESAEYQIFLTFEKYFVPCENKVCERFFFLTKENRDEKEKRERDTEKDKKELSFQGWRADLSAWSATNSQNSL